MKALASSVLAPDPPESIAWVMPVKLVISTTLPATVTVRLVVFSTMLPVRTASSRSLPPPPVTLLLPSPPMMVSAAAVPISVSLPAPPLSSTPAAARLAPVSTPALPVMVPVKPMREEAAAAPTTCTVKAPAPPELSCSRIRPFAWSQLAASVPGLAETKASSTSFSVPSP